MKKRVRRKYEVANSLIVSMPTEHLLAVVSPNAKTHTDVRPFNPDDGGSGGVIEPDDEN